jgi:hypothetical protein
MYPAAEQAEMRRPTASACAPPSVATPVTSAWELVLSLTPYQLRDTRESDASGKGRRHCGTIKPHW